MYSLLAVVAILFLSSVLQGAIGFAAAMLGIPLLVLCGVEIERAVALHVTASLVQNVTAAWHLRKEIVWRDLPLPIVLRTVFQILGAWALFEMRAYRDTTSQIIGAVLFLAVILQRFLHFPPQPRVHPVWSYVAFPSSGFLYGFCSMGGPPAVIWLMAHDWAAARQKAFLFVLFASGLLPQMCLLELFFGPRILEQFLIGSACIPLVYMGTLLGLRIGERIPEEHMRGLSYAVLLMLALGAVVAPMWRA